MPPPTGAVAPAVAMTDPAGRIAYVNPALERATGYSADELIGATYRRLRHRDTPSAVLDDMHEALRRGRPWSAPLRIRARDGRARWVRAHVAPLRDGDATVGYLAVLAQPSPEEVERARAFEASAARGAEPRLGFESGRWVRTDPASRLLRRFRCSLGARHLAGVGAFAATSVGTLWALAPPGPLLWLATAVQLGLAAALAVAFSHRVVAPLRALERTAHRVASGRVDARSGLERHDELGRAGGALDHLALIFTAVVSDLRDEDDGAGVAAGGLADDRAGRSAAAEDRAVAAALRTRALALHAAIEAARIGERGRGLARQSQELRRLARDVADGVRFAARPGAGPGAAEPDLRALERLQARARRLADALDEPPPPDRPGPQA